MATTAGALLIDIVADIAQLRQDLDKGVSEIKGFASQVTGSLKTLTTFATGFTTALTGIGLAMGGASFAAMAKEAINAADNIGDLAEKTGLSTNALQALQYAARDVGAGAGALESGVARLNKTLGEAGAGNKEAIKQFKEMGDVSFHTGGYLRTTEEVLRDVAERMAAAGTVAERTAIATAAFGKGGAALVPVLKDGAAGLDDMISRLREMGVLVDEKSLGQADQLQKKFDALASTIQTTTIKAILALEPVLTTVAEKFLLAAQAAGRFFDRLRAPEMVGIEELDRRIAEVQDKLEQAKKYRPGEVKLFEFQIGELQKIRQTTAALESANEVYTAATEFRPKITAPDDPAAAAKAKREAEKLSDLRVRNAYEAAKAQQQVIDEANEYARKYAEQEAQIAEKLAKDEREAAYTTLLEKLKYEEAYTKAKWDGVEQQRQAAEAAGKAETDAQYAALQKQLEFEGIAEKARADDMAKANEAAKAQLAKQMADRAKALEPLTRAVTGVFDAVDRAFSTTVTGIMQGTLTLEKGFKNMGQSIVLSLQEMVIKQGIDAVKKAFDDLMKSEMVKTLISKGIGLLAGLAGGGAGAAVTIAPVQNIDYNFGGAGMPMAAGGIVQAPTFAVVGEAGPEAVVPLDRWEDVAGGGNVTVNIIDQRKSGNVQTQERTNQNGEREIDVMITDVVRAGISGGAYDRALTGSFGINRKGVTR